MPALHCFGSLNCSHPASPSFRPPPLLLSTTTTLLRSPLRPCFLRPFRAIQVCGEPLIYLPSELFLLRFCIYFGHIRRQTSIIELLCLAYYLHICPVTPDYSHLSDFFHLPTRPTLTTTTMSFNITSDGSPTPRKGLTRFSVAAGDLEIDTSPEVLGQAVGVSQNHYPYNLYRAFGPSLTSSTQGTKRPLGSSALGNQTMVSIQQDSFDTYKVSSMHKNPHVPSH